MGTLATHMEKNLNERDSGLGDRSLYFGASEILACEEAMYLSKVQKRKKPRSLQELIVLIKGNIGETLVEWGLGGAIKFDSQVECQGAGEYEFLKAHADFVVHFPNESIIVEVKTTNDIPETIREGWYLQVQVQLGLLGLKRGKVFAMNLNTGHHAEFDVHFNRLVYESTLRAVKEKWDRIHGPGNFRGTKSALCAYCSFKAECQTLKSDDSLPDEIDAMAKELKALKKKMAVMEENVRAFMYAADLKRARGKSAVVDIAPKTSKRLDFDKLKVQHPDVYKACLKEAGGEVMNIY